MRTVALALALAPLAAPVAADTTWLLQPGVYCPTAGEQVFPIIVGENGALGIDSLDCQAVQLSHGRVTSKKCFANGGSIVPYDTNLLVLARDMLMRREARVGEIGLRVGYESEAAFSRAYKALFGHPPRDEA